MLLAICGGESGYGAYKVLNSPSMVSKRKRFLKLFGALVSLSESISDSAETINVVSKDPKEFLNIGVSRGYKQESGNVSELENSSLTDKVLDRNLVLGFCSNGGQNGGSSDVPKWVYEDKCKELMADCIQRLVSTAVVVYMDKSMNINSYDEMLAGMTNPNHQSKVTDLLVSVCNGVVKTLVRTSHQVLTSSNSGSTRATVNNGDVNASGTRDGFDNGAFVEGVNNGWAIRSHPHGQFQGGLKRSVRVVHEEVIEKGLAVIRYISTESSVIVTVCLAMYLYILDGRRVLLPA
ncbi:hypothetical protein F3Y22_tig00111210pilonHSYRG00156 [Hibiscus syriacus]|uniref:Uncharacterized protein n=1 Tax=Hibiscus syriacus TaxID=106335 RepID=A0A6A2YVH2_HIBSY|nr:hypothetical protein F3Y22_tig00111210pilonHSYRG00156 [Hibiscus syriacus]